MIDIHGHYESIGSNDKILNDYEVFEIPDDVTVKHNNITDLYKLEDPYWYWMYDVPQAQMNGGTKCTVTNNINLLKNIRWYNHWF